MATNDHVLHYGAAIASVDNGAGRRFIESAHTPSMRVPVWLFDDSSSEYIDFPIFLSRRYNGSNIALRLPLSARSTTAPDQFRFEAAFLRLADDTTDFDNASGALSYQGISTMSPDTIGKLVYPEITFTSSQIDGLLAGESGILRLRRNPGHAGDTGTGSGDAELWEPLISAREV